MNSFSVSRSTLRQWLKYIIHSETLTQTTIAVFVSYKKNTPVQLDSSNGQYIQSLLQQFAADFPAPLTNAPTEHLSIVSVLQTIAPCGAKIDLAVSSEQPLNDSQRIGLDKLISTIEISFCTSQENEPEVDLIDFINSLNDHVWIKNNKGEYTYCNNAVEDAWGLPVEDIIGKQDHEVFDESVVETFLRMDKMVVDRDEQIVVDECYRSENGNDPNWLETIKAPIKDSHGQLLGVVGMTRNVSERKFALDKLDMARSLLDKTKEALMITDSEIVSLM